MGRVGDWKREKRNLHPPARRKEMVAGCWGPTSQPHLRALQRDHRAPYHSKILLFLHHSLCPARAEPLSRLGRAISHPSHQAFDDRPQRAVPGSQLGLLV